MVEQISTNYKAGASIIICCYNSEQRIVQTLEYIRNQQVSDQLHFEVIVVNNASTDGTAEVSRTFLETTDLDFTLVDEPNPGLNNARMAGVASAKYEYLLFCDDDNFLCDTYLLRGIEILNQHQNIMILGGCGKPLFEDDEPSWFSKYALNFATGLVPGAKDGGLCDVQDVYGAGMFVRKVFFQVLLKIKFNSIISDRKGDTLISGGDTEYVLLAKYLGFKTAVDDDLRFDHLMPKKRMTLAYLKKLHFGFGRTRLYTQAYMKVFSYKTNKTIHLKLPLWRDKLVHKKRELRRYYPKIWFKVLNEKNLDYILKHEALCGEIQELSSIKNKYSDILEELKELKVRIDEYKNV